MSLKSWSVEELAQEVESEKLVMVDFKAPWCPQCGPQVRAFERVSEKYADKVSFGTLDLADHEEAATVYDVSVLPTLILFKDGKPFEELKGFSKAPVISKALDRAITE